jgi:predicted membrane protein
VNAAKNARETRLLHVATVAAVAAAVFGAYHGVLGLGMLGYDAYPMIATARIQGWSDFAGTFGEELMDGRFPGGHFYRPVTNLSFALDHALWGLDPFGYHLTDLLIFAINGALLCAFARRLFGADAWLAGLVAALVFVLHPMQLETIPVPPRRADSLCLGFALACLLSAAPAGEPPGARARLRGALSAAFALLAAGSKETGVIAAPLVLGLAFLCSPAGCLAARVREALRHGLPSLAAVALFVAVRTAVLGGFGGHPSEALLRKASLSGLFKPYLAHLFAPQRYELSGLWIAALCLLALALAALLVWKPPRRADARRLGSGLAFLLLWFVCLFAIHSLADRARVWYATVFVAPYAVFLGVMTQIGVGLLREKRVALAALALAFSLGLAATHIRYSSLLHTYTEWIHADALGQAFLVRFARAVREAEPGSTLRFVRFPTRVERPSEPPGVRSAVVFHDYSLQAWADLMLPEHPVEARMYVHGAPPPPPHPSAVSVMLHPLVVSSDDAHRSTRQRKPAPQTP